MNPVGNLFKRVMPWMTSPLEYGRFQNNRRARSMRHRPHHATLYPGQLYFYNFSFDGKMAPQVGPLGTQHFTWAVTSDFLVYGLSGAILNTADPNADFMLQILQDLNNTEQKTVRPWWNKPVLQAGVLGNGQSPNYLKDPFPVAKGHSLTCQVQSLSSSTTPSTFQVVLHGIILDPA